MLTFEAEPLFTPQSPELRFLPEGPRVLRNSGLPFPALGWVSIQHAADATTGSFNILNLETLENDEHRLPARPGFFAETDQPGVLVLGLEHALVLYDIAARHICSKPFGVTGDPRVIINEGLPIEGGLLFGTKHLHFQQPIACLYWFDASSRTLHTLDHRQVCSNGKFLRDGLLLDIDSFKKTLDAFPIDFKTPALGERRIVADFRDTPLFPDGLRPAPDGESVIVAFYNPEPAPFGLARQIRIVDGEALTEWRLPGSPRVTCPELVRMDGSVKILFTTAVEGMEPPAPLAGQMFLAATPFSTIPAPPPLFPAAALREVR
jgi:sugar lactone lactonase YvrE